MFGISPEKQLGHQAHKVGQEDHTESDSHALNGIISREWLVPNWIMTFDVAELQWCNRKKFLQYDQRDRQDNDTNYPKKTLSIFVERFHIASC